MIRRFVTCLVLAASLALWVASAKAADDVLSMVPKDALGLVVVNRLAEIDAKIQKLGEVMQLPAPSLLAMLQATTGIGEGLDEKGSAALVLLPGKDGSAEPAQILFVPVSDFQKFVAPLKPDDASAKVVKIEVMNAALLAAKRGSFAVLTVPKYGDLLNRAPAKSAKAPDELAPLGKWLADNDAAIVVTRAGVELIVTKGREGLKVLKQTFALMGDEMAAAAAAFEVYDKILEAAGKEIQTCAHGVQLDKDGALRLSSRTRFVAGGEAAQLVNAVKPPTGNLLAGLPAGPYVFAGAGLMPAQLATALAEFSIDMMKAAPQIYGLSGEQADKLAEISGDAMKGIQRMSMVMGVGKAGAPIYNDMAALLTVADAKTFLASYEKYIAAMNEIVKGSKSSVLSTVDVKKLTIDGRQALQVSMDLPKAPLGKTNIPGYDEMMKKLFGKEGKMVAYVAAVDDHRIVMAYTSPELLKKVIETAKSGEDLAGDKDTAQTTALLPAGAQWVGYVSPKGTIDFINRVVPALAPPEAKFQLPAFPPTPPIGLAAKAADGGLEAELIVPSAVLKAIGQYIPQVAQMEAGAGPKAEEPAEQ